MISPSKVAQTIYDAISAFIHGKPSAEVEKTRAEAEKLRAEARRIDIDTINEMLTSVKRMEELAPKDRQIMMSNFWTLFNSQKQLNPKKKNHR